MQKQSAFEPFLQTSMLPLGHFYISKTPSKSKPTACIRADGSYKKSWAKVLWCFHEAMYSTDPPTIHDLPVLHRKAEGPSDDKRVQN